MCLPSSVSIAFPQPYKEEFYFYETIQMCFKLTLWGVVVFLPKGSQFQHAANMMVCFVQLGVHARLQPFNTHLKNGMQYVALSIVAFTSFAGLVLNYLEAIQEIYRLELKDDMVEVLKGQVAGFKIFIEIVMYCSLSLITFGATRFVYTNVKKYRDKRKEKKARKNSKHGKGPGLIDGSKTAEGEEGIDIPVIKEGKSSSTSPSPTTGKGSYWEDAQWEGGEKNEDDDADGVPFMMENPALKRKNVPPTRATQDML